jgi:hypothetical protein
MKRTFGLLTLIAALNLSGCVVLDGRSYHNDHGDLVSDDGSVRYEAWCELHPTYQHCSPTRVAESEEVSSTASPR